MESLMMLGGSGMKSTEGDREFARRQKEVTYPFEQLQCLVEVLVLTTHLPTLEICPLALMSC